MPLHFLCTITKCTAPIKRRQFFVSRVQICKTLDILHRSPKVVDTFLSQKY